MKNTEKTKLTVVKDEKEEVKEFNKPTPEEVAQFKQDFEDAMKKFHETRWEISDKGNYAANDVAFFISDFMKRFAFWSKNGWMGMIKMDEELKHAASLANEETGLTFDYQTLEFCAYMLSNPGGVGYELALEMEKIADKFSKIGIVIGEKVEDARKQLKDIQYLQEKWAAGEQGFYLSELEPKAEEENHEQLEEKSEDKQ